MVHRDVNPSNYIFYEGKPYAIDFESSWSHAHPVRDLGILTAELKNEFKWYKGGSWKAEPYIGNFLWEYSNDEKDFTYITKVLPFFHEYRSTSFSAHSSRQPQKLSNKRST